MKKHFFVLGLVGLLSLLMACSDLADSAAYSKQGGGTNKVKVSLSCTSSARSTIMPTNLEFADITKISLTAKKLKGANSYVDYDLDESDTDSTAKIWLPSGEGVTSLTAYENMTSDSLELDFGSYVFTLDLYTDYTETDGEGNSTTKSRITQTGTLGNEDEETPYTINADTTTLSFTTEYVDYGRLSLNFQWDCTSEGISKIGKVEAGLFTISSNGATALTNGDTNYDFEELNLTEPELSDDGENWKITAVYEKTEIQNGSYYLKYRFYDETNKNVLNTITSIVKIFGYKTEETIEINLEKINNLPKSAGDFYIDDSRIEFTAESEGSLYLNSGTINLNAYKISEGPEEGRIDTSKWTAKLYYGGQEVDSECYEFWDDGFVKIGENKPLVIGGMYQLYVTAENVLDYATVIASTTFDFEVQNKEYFEYNLSGSDPEFLSSDLTEKMQNLTADALVVIKGDPDKTDGLNYAKGYFSAISSALTPNTLYKVDLDMSDAGSNLSTLSSEDGFSDCSCLNSIKLSESVTSIGFQSFKDLSGLVSFAILNYGYKRDIDDGAFYNCSALDSFEIINADIEGVGSAYRVTANGKVLTGDIPESGPIRQKVIAVAATLENFDLTDETLFPDARNENNGSYFIEQIGAYAFANHSNLKSISGLDKITAIGDSAFASCKFASLTIDSIPTTVGDCVFDNAEVTELVVDVDVTSEDYDNFEKLISVLPEGAESRKGIQKIDTVKFNKKAYFPTLEKEDDYQQKKSLFYDSRYNLKSLTFSGQSSIGKYQFYSYGYLNTVIFNDSSNSSIIEESAFENSNDVTTLDLTGVKMIGRKAFYTGTNNYYLSEIVIPDSVIAIGYAAFYKIMSSYVKTFIVENTSGWYTISDASAETTVKGWISDSSTAPTATTIGTLTYATAIDSTSAQDTIKSFMSPSSTPSSSDTQYNYWLYRLAD